MSIAAKQRANEDGKADESFCIHTQHNEDQSTQVYLEQSYAHILARYKHIR